MLRTARKAQRTCRLTLAQADGDRDGEGAPQRGASLSRIKREAKLIPPLVHATECWEKQLVRLHARGERASHRGLGAWCAHACMCLGARPPS